MATPLQYSCLQNPMDRGALWAAVHVGKESDTTEAKQAMQMYLFNLVLVALGLCRCEDFFPIAASGVCASAGCVGFSLLWLLSLWSTGQ